jgi:hypothetical protein
MPSSIFEQARLKITRSDKHIADAQAIVSSLPDSYTVSIENYGSGRQAIKYELPNADRIAIDLSLVVGDALHNLKTALDYAWIGAIAKHAPSAIDKFSKFPVRDTPQELEDALKGRKIDVSSLDLYKRIMSDIKPYAGGDDAVYRLHRLDISDKHHLLIPLMYLAAIDGIVLEDKHGKIERGGTWAVTRPGPYFIDLEGNWHIKEKGKLTTAVVFKNGLSLEGMEVMGLLFSFSMATINVVNLLEHL